MINKDKLKQNIKISDIISAEGGDLIKQGKNQYLCRCINPNHIDKNPSMAINDEKGIFKCFSKCGIGGDIFNVLYYMRPDIKGFYNQLEYLEKNYYGKITKQTHFLLEKQEIQSNYQNDKDFIEIMNYIANYWALKLSKEVKDKYLLNNKIFSYMDNKGVLVSMQGYGLSEDIIKKYKIGYSENNSKLYKELLMRFDKKLIDKTSLFDKKGVSFFKNRITIPYFKNGNVVYFSSRQTEFSPINKYEKAKYKNQKIDNKYYFNEDDLNNYSVFITEGYFDCLSIKNIGYNAISLGGLYIKNKKKIIEGLKNSLAYIVFDNDLNKAGNNKAIELNRMLKENGVDSYIITIPLEKNKNKIDINEYLGKKSKNDFDKLITKSI